MNIYTLLDLVTPNLQIVDGEVIAKELGCTEPALVLRAVDSTSWDIETNLEEIETIIRGTFSNVREYD